jgi:hypothetical protein
MSFFLTLVDLHTMYAGSTLPAVAAAITTSSGWTWSEGKVNEFFVGMGPPMDYTGFLMPSTGWGVSISWNNNYVFPTLDAGKTFELYLDHTLTAVTIDRSIEFQVGGNAGQTIRVGFRDVSAAALRLEGLTVLGATEADSHVKADKAIRSLDQALNRVNEEQSRIGAWQNRLQQSVQNTGQASEQQSASQATIRDADFALESAALTRHQVLMNASSSLLSQANIVPQMALSLLKAGDPGSSP